LQRRVGCVFGTISLAVRCQQENVSLLTPSNFQVNEAWIAFKLNDAPLMTKADGDFNVIALMDAASCFILGTEFVRADSAEPSQIECERLLKSGRAHKQCFPKRLLIPADQAAGILSAEAERNGIAVVRAPEQELLVFIGEARQSFQEHVSGARVQ
jgi:hypothetical protein